MPLKCKPYAATAKLLQSCPTLCDPMDGSPRGFPTPGILQARTLEWVAISFSNEYSELISLRIDWFDLLAVQGSLNFFFHFSLSCIGEGNGNPLQCSCLENPRDSRAWWAAVSGVTQSWTRLKQLSSSSSSSMHNHISRLTVLLSWMKKA